MSTTGRKAPGEPVSMRSGNSRYGANCRRQPRSALSSTATRRSIRNASSAPTVFAAGYATWGRAALPPRPSWASAAPTPTPLPRATCCVRLPPEPPPTPTMAACWCALSRWSAQGNGGEYKIADPYRLHEAAKFFEMSHRRQGRSGHCRRSGGLFHDPVRLVGRVQHHAEAGAGKTAGVVEKAGHHRPTASTPPWSN